MLGSTPTDGTPSSLALLERLDAHNPDCWIFAAALYGLIVGCYTLSRKPWATRQEASLEWRESLRETISTLLIAATATQFGMLLTRLSPFTSVLYARAWPALAMLLSYVVMSYVQRRDYSRREPSGIAVRLFWAFLQLALTARLYALMQSEAYLTDVSYFAVFCVGYGLTALQLVLGYGRQAGEGGHRKAMGSSRSLFSRLTLSWLTPVLRHGYRRPLTDADLCDLPESLSALSTGDAFGIAWSNTKESQRPAPAVVFALLKAYGRSFAMGGLLKFVSDICAFVQPWLLGRLLLFVGTYSYQADIAPRPWNHGVMIAVWMFLFAVLQTVTSYQYQQMVARTSMEVHGGLSSVTYKKVLRLSSESLCSQAASGVVNSMAVDTRCFRALVQKGHQLWSTPFQVFLCATVLYSFVGRSLLAGLAIMMLMVPLGTLVTTGTTRLHARLIGARDERIRLVSEMIDNIKTIKLYAWTSDFLERLRCLRENQELRILRRLGTIHSMASLSWTAAPLLMSCATFASYVLLEDQPLSTDIAFPVLVLFNMLAAPLALFPASLAQLSKACDAANRIGTFLRKAEVQQGVTTFDERTFRAGERAVIVRDGDFSWQFDDYGNTLGNINFSARRGQLCSIAGQTGSGKSSLLNAILGELCRTRGEVIVRGSVAYASQNGWLLGSTVRDNIVFGQRFDPSRYHQTVVACALLEDIADLPHGDETLIGERGVAVSGSQKARISLARAVYSQADIYLLDDCLSAVDAHVAQHLMRHVLGPHGLLQSRTRILATNSQLALVLSDHVVFLGDGTILEQGSPAELLSLPDSHVAELLTQNQTSRSQSWSSGQSTSALYADNDSTIDKIQEHDTDITEPSIEDNSDGRNSRITRRFHEEADLRSISTSAELASRGHTKWQAFVHYLGVIGLGAATASMTILVIAQVAQLAGITWLKIWTEAGSYVGGTVNNSLCVGIYLAIGLGSGLATHVQGLVIGVLYSNNASRKIHRRLAKAIFASPTAFFDITPAGQIISRFADNMKPVDEDLCRLMNMILSSAAQVFCAVAVISFAAPGFLALVVPLAALCLWVQAYYVSASRDLRCHESYSLGPVYAHFKYSLVGMATIRAFRQQGRFEAENAFRIDNHLRALYPSVSANHWLGLRLDLIGALIVLSSACFCVLSVAMGSGLSAGLVGLAMSYSLQIAPGLNGLARHFVEVQSSIASLARVLDYCDLPPGRNDDEWNEHRTDTLPESELPGRWSYDSESV